MQVVALRLAVEEARREEVAGAGGVDDLGDWLGLDLGARAVLDRASTVLAAGDD